ncbi:MAG: MBL fold metallo-hydrolase RNA specificity domain-containing protein [Pirellulales bacterium]
MFHWDRGLFLTPAGLAVDVCRRQPRGFISHAHADHLGTHELALCTPDTACLYRHRRGAHRRVWELPFRMPRELGPLQLTSYPAGHCLGSAMLLARQSTAAGQQQSLLYTGDFKLGQSATCIEAELPQADILVMECTFGRPQYRLPPRMEMVAELIELVRRSLEAERTPVLHLYPLGKGQEITRLLTMAGIPVLQHPMTYAVSEIYQNCGIDLGNVSRHDEHSLVDGQVPPGHAVVTIPRRMRNFRLRGIQRPVSIAVTGWALDASAKVRWDVDHALPLSDHADFNQLLETAERVGAKKIYCTHGPREFVDHLREAGFNAFPLMDR